MNIIAEKTNLRIQDTIDSLSAKHNIGESDKYSWIKTTDIIELKALFGLMYFRGLLGGNHNSVESLFSDTQGHYIFSAVMSKNRFKFLLSHLTFDDYQDRQERWKLARFAAIRDVLESFNDNLGKYLAPSEYESLNETLYPMCHQIAFHQYNPKKPHHYGILFKSLNDARYPYTYKPVTYASKLKSRQGPYYIKSMIDYVKYRVTKTEKQQNLHGRNISTNRLYASVELSKWLLTRNITTVATV